MPPIMSTQAQRNTNVDEAGSSHSQDSKNRTIDLEGPPILAFAGEAAGTARLSRR